MSSFFFKYNLTGHAKIYKSIFKHCITWPELIFQVDFLKILLKYFLKINLLLHGVIAGLSSGNISVPQNCNSIVTTAIIHFLIQHTPIEDTTESDHYISTKFKKTLWDTSDFPDFTYHYLHYVNRLNLQF